MASVDLLDDRVVLEDLGRVVNGRERVTQEILWREEKRELEVTLDYRFKL